MKHLKLLFVFACLLSASNTVKAQCNQELPSFPEHQGRIVTLVNAANEYFMKSTDPAAGKNFQERTANLREQVISIFKQYIDTRTAEFKSIQCTYHVENTCRKSGQGGGLKLNWKTITAAEGMEFMPSTLVMVRSSPGALKRGPTYDRNTFTFASGITSVGTAIVTVTISAKYGNAGITSRMNEELTSIRAELNKLKLPTDNDVTKVNVVD